MISQAPLKILVAFGRSIKECHLQCLQLEKGIDQLLLQICFITVVENSSEKIMTEQAHGLRLHANRDVYPLHRMKLVVRMVALSIQEQAMQQLK